MAGQDSSCFFHKMNFDGLMAEAGVLSSGTPAAEKFVHSGDLKK